MSTDFRPLTPIRMEDLFDGRLEDVGVHEHHSKEATSRDRCLTDGVNFLWRRDRQLLERRPVAPD
jgi:hypothetical protein